MQLRKLWKPLKKCESTQTSDWVSLQLEARIAKLGLVTVAMEQALSVAISDRIQLTRRK